MGKRAQVTVRSDALERAANTLWQGFGVDAVVLIGLGLTELMASGDPTSGAFWATIGILVVKSLLTAAASYMVRLKFPAATTAQASAPQPASPPAAADTGQLVDLEELIHPPSRL